ncbi:MAG: ABC transporter ATP-binding protein [Firmicutes bacterium]|nr:ABC transporter ATP-binding protein [Bacillota bacterium]
MDNKDLIRVENLKTYFYTDQGVVKAVDGVSFSVKSKKVLGVVGESGCGKSITALSIMQLLPKPHGKIESGHIYFDRGEKGILDLAAQKPRSKVMQSIRGNEIAMIFQEPMTSLNPVYTIGEQIVEAILLHQKVSEKEAWEKATEMLAHVGIPSPSQRVKEYPHQLSGGMRQRAMIAMALSCNPRFLIADEPTTALDVTIQAQILDLMRRLQGEHQMSIMMITHDLGVVARMCDDVVVMYTGKIVERADVRTLFKNPLHPYTQGLLASIPTMGQRKRRLDPIKGTVPEPFNLPSGCRFRTRCPKAMDICSRQEPPEVKMDEGHEVKCWLYEKSGEVLAG